jgi:hypothetical protein
LALVVWRKALIALIHSSLPPTRLLSLRQFQIDRVQRIGHALDLGLAAARAAHESLQVAGDFSAAGQMSVWSCPVALCGLEGLFVGGNTALEALGAASSLPKRSLARFHTLSQSLRTSVSSSRIFAACTVAF